MPHAERMAGQPVKLGNALCHVVYDSASSLLLR